MMNFQYDLYHLLRKEIEEKTQKKQKVEVDDKRESLTKTEGPRGFKRLGVFWLCDFAQEGESFAKILFQKGKRNLVL